MSGDLTYSSFRFFRPLFPLSLFSFLHLRKGTAHAFPFFVMLALYWSRLRSAGWKVLLSICSSESPCRDIIPPPPGIRQSWAAAVFNRRRNRPFSACIGLHFGLHVMRLLVMEFTLLVQREAPARLLRNPVGNAHPTKLCKGHFFSKANSTSLVQCVAQKGCKVYVSTLATLRPPANS